MSTIATETTPGKNRRRSKWHEAFLRVVVRVWGGFFKYIVAAGYLTLLGIFWLAQTRLPSGNTAGLPSPPSPDHQFGTNFHELDVFQLSLASGASPLASGFIAAFGGILLAILTGWFFVLPRKAGPGFRFLRRASKCFGFIPGLLFVLLMSIGLGPGFWQTTILLSIVVWIAAVPRCCDWFEEMEDRGDTIAATALGMTRSQIIRGSHLSSVAKRGITLACGLIPGLVLAETALSFIGFGIGPGTWGSQLADGRAVIFEAPWLTIYPGIITTLTLIALATLGWLARKSMNGDVPPRLF